MIKAYLPADEALRLKDLDTYKIMYSSLEDEFDEIIELASSICKTPVSLISLLDETTQWFKAKKGIIASLTTRDVAFCAHTILQTETLVVEDALEDERFADNPLVTGEPHVRFYAGTPIVSPTGYNLGALCIIDHKPRKLSAEEDRALTILSRQITRLLDLRRKNILLRESAQEKITEKTNTVSRILQEQEKEKLDLAVKMHEDLAQRLAASLLYFDMAEKDLTGREELLQTSRQCIHQVMDDMRKLTYAITPYTSTLIPTEDLINEYVLKIAPTFRFKTAVDIACMDGLSTPLNALTAVRVIEGWLDILAHQTTTSQVKIFLECISSFQLRIESGSTSKLQPEAMIKKSLLRERVTANNGQLHFKMDAAGLWVLEITLPINAGK